MKDPEWIWENFDPVSGTFRASVCPTRTLVFMVEPEHMCFMVMVRCLLNDEDHKQTSSTDDRRSSAALQLPFQIESQSHRPGFIHLTTHMLPCLLLWSTVSMQKALAEPRRASSGLFLQRIAIIQKGAVDNEAQDMFAV